MFTWTPINGTIFGSFNKAEPFTITIQAQPDLASGATAIVRHTLLTKLPDVFVVTEDANQLTIDAPQWATMSLFPDGYIRYNYFTPQDVDTIYQAGIVEFPAGANLILYHSDPKQLLIYSFTVEAEDDLGVVGTADYTLQILNNWDIDIAYMREML